MLIYDKEMYNKDRKRRGAVNYGSFFKKTRR